MDKKLFFAVILLVVLIIGCSKNGNNIEIKNPSPKIYAVSDTEISGKNNPKIYEIYHDGPFQWLHDTREKRSNLNSFRHYYNKENDNKLREDRKMSRNWKLMIGSKTYTGYDVIRYHRGEFGRDKELKREKRGTVISFEE